MKEKLRKLTKNKMVVGIFCIGIALVFSLLSMNLKAGGQGVKNVVVTTKEIGVGDKITDEMIDYKKLSGDITGLVTNKEDVVGKYASISMLKGDYVTSGKLSTEAIYGSAYLENLGEEDRAISVSITSNAKGLSGKLESGDIVSVILSSTENQEDKKDTYIPEELKYVEIISVSDTSGYDVGSSEEAKKIGSTVTLLVREEQSLILANAEGLNDIHFQLVHRGNDERKQKLLEEQKRIIKGEPLEETQSNINNVEQSTENVTNSVDNSNTNTTIDQTTVNTTNSKETTLKTTTKKQ